MAVNKEKAISMDIIIRAQQGNEIAVNQIYETMYKRVYYFALKIVGNAEDAEDATQETFVSAFKALGKLENTDAFQSWLYQIASNKSRDILKKNKKQETVDVSNDEEDNDYFLEKQPDKDENLIPEDALDNEAKRNIILGIINSLPDNQKECVMMFYYSEMGIREIAETLGVSEGTVKSRLNYARQKIKDSVLETEEKQDIRLHALIPLGLFLFKDFETLTASLPIPALAAGSAGAAAATATAGATATGAAATTSGTAAAGASASAAAVGTAAKATAAGAAKVGLLATLKGKIIAAVVAGLLVVGGATAAFTVPDMIGSGGSVGTAPGAAIHQEIDIQQLVAQAGPVEPVDAGTCLENIAYYGDRSKCVMPKEMAEGYAEVLSGLPQSSGGAGLKVLLADPNGDGMPVLITTYVNNSKQGSGNVDIYHFENGKVSKSAYKEDNGAYFGKYNGAGAVITVNLAGDPGVPGVYQVFTIQNGALKKAADIKSYSVVVNEAEYYALGSIPDNAGYDFMDISYNSSVLANDGWQMSMNYGYENWSKVIENGKNATSKYANSSAGMAVYNALCKTPIYDYEFNDYYTFNQSVTASADAVAYLQDYAKVVGKPSYNYPEISTLLPANHKDAIASAVTGDIDGDMGEIFVVADDLFYVIMYKNEEPVGGALVKATISDASGYRLVNAGTELYTEEDLSAAVRQDQSVSNIYLEYSEAGKNKIKYLKQALNQIDGTQVNDSAKEDIVKFVQMLLAEESTVNVKSVNNSVIIDDAAVMKAIGNMDDIKKEINAALEGIDFGGRIEVAIRVACKNIDAGSDRFVTFELTAEDYAGVVDAILIDMGDTQDVISISYDEIQTLLKDNQTTAKISSDNRIVF
ncbi:MAG: sigma-70 family RNA polymerase sigma factor [Firmicutes bacterium]|nr:sigma-70 family RNA polymerase sigma factor [Bacillota bacterium]